MKEILKIVLWGFLLWLLVFAISFIIFPFKQAQNPLFETLIAIAITAITIVFAIILFIQIDEEYLNYGIKTGITWLFLNILLDLPLFSFGSMAMSMKHYFEDIGLTYLVIPLITIGIGWLLERKIKKPKDEHIHLKNAENKEVS